MAWEMMIGSVITMVGVIIGAAIARSGKSE